VVCLVRRQGLASEPLPRPGGRPVGGTASPRPVTSRATVDCSATSVISGPYLLAVGNGYSLSSTYTGFFNVVDI
jgi:hypothetical protein